MIIVGSCLESMQPKAYKELEQMSNNIYDVCLEKEHLNMVVTKIIGMVARGKIKKLVFATVDKSPHCVQLHYVVKELENAIDLSNINKDYINYYLPCIPETNIRLNTKTRSCRAKERS